MSKAAIIAALEGRSLDRLPIQILTYDGYYARCAGRKQWEFDYGTIAGQLEMQLAAIRRHPQVDAWWTWTGMNRGPQPGVRINVVDGDPFAVYEDGRRLPLADFHGMFDRSPEEHRLVLDRYRVKHQAEIEDKCGPVVNADELLARLPGYSVLRRLADQVGEEKFLWFNQSSLFASASTYLGGIEEAWIQSAENSALVEAILDYLLLLHLEYIEAGARAGGHGVWNCFMNEGANILSPETWRRLVKPRVARIVERSHQLGLKHVAWFLDDCRELVADLIEIGVDGIATEQPRGHYYCDPGELRRRAGDSNLCIFGWFLEEDLLKGNREAAGNTLRNQWMEAGGGKPFVVNTPGLTQEYDPYVIDMVIEESLRLTG